MNLVLLAYAISLWGRALQESILKSSARRFGLDLPEQSGLRAENAGGEGKERGREEEDEASSGMDNRGTGGVGPGSADAKGRTMARLSKERNDGRPRCFERGNPELVVMDMERLSGKTGELVKADRGPPRQPTVKRTPKSTLLLGQKKKKNGGANRAGALRKDQPLK